MLSKNESLEWLHHHINGYRSHQDGISDVVEESGQEGKLGQGFSSLDSLEEVDLCDGSVCKPTYVSTKLSREEKEKVCCLVKEFTDYFVWSYTEIHGSSRDLVEHKLPIKGGLGHINNQLGITILYYMTASKRRWNACLKLVSSEHVGTSNGFRTLSRWRRRIRIR
jgi:hypothetical protein